MKNLLLVIASALLLAACSKNVTTTTYVDNNAKKVLLFKEGSYWIYRDSITGRVDSSYIYAQRQDLSKDWGYRHSYYDLVETIDFDFKLVPYDTANKDNHKFTISIAGNSISVRYYLNSKSEKFQALNNGVSIPMNNYKSGVWLSKGVRFLNSYNVSGKEYTDVGEIGGLFDQRVYFNDSIGLIKFSVIKSEWEEDTIKYVWELQRCKIVR